MDRQLLRSIILIYIDIYVTMVTDHPVYPLGKSPASHEALHLLCNEAKRGS